MSNAGIDDWRRERRLEKKRAETKLVLLRLALVGTAVGLAVAGFFVYRGLSGGSSATTPPPATGSPGTEARGRSPCCAGKACESPSSASPPIRGRRDWTRSPPR